jgi:multidrug resistance efflux pump
MQPPLFREEAISSYHGPRFGDIQEDSGRMFLAIATGLVLVLLLAVWLIGTSTYSRKHFITGQIDEPNANAIVSRDWGFVELMNVTEGQQVNAGAHILTAAKTNDGRLSAMAAETRQQMMHWESMNEAINEAFASEDRASLVTDRQLSVLETLAREGIDLQVSKVEQLADHHSNTTSIYEAGFLSNLDWVRFKTSLISERQRLNVLRKNLIEQQVTRSELRADRSALKTKRNRQRTELKSKLSTLREKLIELEQKPYQKLVATRSGTVTRVEVSKGANIRPGQPLVYINSSESKVTGTLNIPPGAAGHLASGQQLALELDAFPAHIYGRIDAVVTQLSPHTVSTPGQNGYFRARLSIQSNERIDSILPGMTFRTYIPMEQQTLFSWFLKPLRKLGESLG